MCMSVGKSSPTTSIYHQYVQRSMGLELRELFGVCRVGHATGGCGGTSRCWMMTSLCLNVFETGQLTEFGAGLDSSENKQVNGPLGCLDCSERGTVAYYVALMSGLAASVMMLQLIRGALGRKSQQSNEEERFNEIQFTTLKNGVVD